jgi:hypothetical protein
MSLSPKTFTVGDTVRVTVSFKYVIGVNATVKLFAGPCYTNIFGKHMVNACIGQADVSLATTSTPTAGSTTIDFLLVPKAQSGVEDGTYGLRVWIEDTNAIAEQDNVVIVTGNPSSSDMFSSIMPMVMMLMIRKVGE